MTVIVIKIGTYILTTESGALDLNNLREICKQVSLLLKNSQTRCLIVSSGAIACGTDILKSPPTTIPEKQAAASIGQIQLMKEYALFLGQAGFQIGQVLLTKEGLNTESQKINAKNTLSTLLDNRIIPIINENDTVATDEIRFGDNDELSSIVARLIKADKLIMLTDINGVYTADPKTSKDANLIPSLDSISDDLIEQASPANTGKSKGGMKSKLMAAKLAQDAGIDTIIANGRQPNVLVDILDGKQIGTLMRGKKG